MKKIFISTVLLVVFGKHIALAQTLTLQPDATAGKDATINSYSLYNNSNFGSYTDFDAGTWTQGGTPFTWRSLIDFDLSGVPANAVITSAYLSFYYDATSTHFGGIHSGQNDSYLQRITQSWQENTVTWNNQPSVTTQNQVSIAATTTASQDLINIDVTALVTDIKNNPASSFGFMLRMQNENPYDDVVLASSDNSNPLKRPELVITYCVLPATTITIQPDAAFGKDATINSYSLYNNSNFGSYTDFDAGTWTQGGTLFTWRSLIEFDLSGVPANAVITSAYLSFYYDATSTHFGGVHSGQNDSYLQRITQSWQENTVTWNNQPSVTTQNQVSIAATTTASQDLINIDVTALTTDMKNNPASSFGFMLRMQNENPYDDVVLASSDHPDPGKHPKLVISYFLPSIVANGPVTFCAGGSVLLSANSGTGSKLSMEKK